jgi:selenide, water dikinase
MAELAQVLRHVFPTEDPNALVDASTGDDAAVYLLEENRALVVTTDFFTPIVDDPYQYGQIAAANALSDIYAMGARPLFALNLLAFPRARLDEGALEQIVRGGADKAREAGIPILGGHSIDDAEPKYGLVAIGEVDPREMTTNSAARPGQRLVLTKAIGTGIIATAIKAGTADAVMVEAATRSMAALNRGAAEAMREAGIRAATDVTGFGLLGHLRQMLRASGVAARVVESAVPLLPGALELAGTARFPGGSLRNLADLREDVSFPENLPEARRTLLADAQTSGGLLMAVPEELLPELLHRLAGKSPVAAVIGEVEEGLPGRIRVV